MAILKLKWDLSLAVVSEEHGYRIEPQNTLVLLCGWALCSISEGKKSILHGAFYMVKACEDLPGMSRSDRKQLAL